jgi:RimJ/RimL family protein N-acetyltransferase
VNVPLIRTKRLLLCDLRDEDTAAYAEMCADPEVMRYLGSGPLTLEDAWRQLAMFAGHWTLRGFGMWAENVTEEAKRVGA